MNNQAYGSQTGFPKSDLLDVEELTYEVP